MRSLSNMSKDSTFIRGYRRTWHQETSDVRGINPIQDPGLFLCMQSRVQYPVRTYIDKPAFKEHAWSNIRSSTVTCELTFNSREVRAREYPTIHKNVSREIQYLISTLSTRAGGVNKVRIKQDPVFQQKHTREDRTFRKTYHVRSECKELVESPYLRKFAELQGTSSATGK